MPADIDRGQAVEVSLGECRCPGSPHLTDTVWMKPKSDLAMGLAAEAALRQASNFAGDNEAAVYSVFVRHGVIRWNIVNEQGPVPITPDNLIDRLGWLEGGKAVATRGRELYQDQIFAPLAIPSVDSPPPTPSNGSTSRSPNSGAKHRTSQPPSSPSEPADSP